jgi:hypothetical protein
MADRHEWLIVMDTGAKPIAELSVEMGPVHMSLSQNKTFAFSLSATCGDNNDEQIVPSAFVALPKWLSLHA